MSKTRKKNALLCASLTGILVNTCVFAEDFKSQFRSYQSLRFDQVVQQQRDYSCGAAALATILRFYYQQDVGELELLEQASVLSGIDQSSLKEKGLSLLDLRKLAQARGFRAGGFRLTEAQARQLRGPVLIHYEPRAYPHFAVLKGISGKYAYLSDPVRGNVKEHIAVFMQAWDGSSLVIEPDDGSIGSGLLLPDEQRTAMDVSLRNQLSP